VAAVLLAVSQVAGALWYEAHPTLVNDATFYFVVGRGILNGLVPYRDLWETKPPGIFLISALSIALTNGPMLAKVAFVTFLCAIPVLFVLGAIVLHPNAPSRALSIGVSLLYGLMLSSYTQAMSADMTTEAWGASLCIAYLVLLHWRQSKERPWTPLIGFGTALLLLCTIGLKETFMPITFAVAVLSVRSVPDLLKWWVFPLLVAAALGITILFCFGWTAPYFSIYLKDMVFHHGSYIPSTVWERTFWWRATIENLNRFSGVMTILITLLLGSALVLSFVQAKEWTVRIVVATLATSFAIGVGYNFYRHYFVLAAR